MIDRFLKGNEAAETGSLATDLGRKPNAEEHYSWTAPDLTGEL